MLKISLGRRLLSVILTTMLPTAIIVIVALSTNYYNTDHHFKTIIPVNLTCLLMMVTMSIGVSASLPKTGFSNTLTFFFTFQFNQNGMSEFFLSFTKKPYKCFLKLQFEY
jgi:hypothetical protein